MPPFFTQVREQERDETLWAFATAFLVLVAHAILEVARDAIFLTHLPASRLPWVYLAIAGLALLATRPLSRTRGAQGDLRQLVILQVAAAVGTLALLVIVRSKPVWAIDALYIWGGLASAAILIRFWLFLSDRFTIRQAKRLFPIIAAGPLLGSLVGYAVAGFLYRKLLPVDLLAVSAFVFLLSAGGSLLLSRALSTAPSDAPVEPEPSAVPEPSLLEGIQLAARHTYLRRVVLLLFVASVTITLADFVFKSVVARDIPAARIGSFLSLSYLAFDLIALGLLFTAVVPFVRALGVSQALTIEPRFLLVGATLLTVMGGLLPALCVRGVDGALHWSLHKTATELLYVPLSARLRSAVKALTDIVAHRGGQALGSVVILGCLAFSPSERVLGPLIAVCAVAWICLARLLRAPYLELFRETLKQGSIETRLDFPELDMASLETLIAALSNPDERKVCAAMYLLQKTQRTPLMPALILYHPSPQVVLRALEMFATTRRHDILPTITHLLQHPDSGIRAAAIRASALIQPDVEYLRQATKSETAAVAVTALVILTAQGHLDAAETGTQLVSLLDQQGDAAGEVGRSLARAMRDHPVAALATLLDRLATDGDIETRREAIQAMRASRDAVHLPTLIRSLAIRELRQAARDALLAHGDAALRCLEKALVDHSLSRATRIHLPRTISAFSTQAAADVLLRHLSIEPSGAVRYKILRGLGRLIDDPQLQLDSGLVDEVIERQLAGVIENLHWLVALQDGVTTKPERRTTGHELLVSLLRQRDVLSIERLFRALGLRYRDADFGQIYNGLQSPEAGNRSSSRELLEGVLPSQLAKLVLSLTDASAPSERLAALQPRQAEEQLDYEDLLRQLMCERSLAVRHLASYHATELGVSDIGAEPASAADQDDWLSRLCSRAREPDSFPSGLRAHA